MASQITGVSIVCTTVCSGADQRKHQSSASLPFVRRIHRSPVNSPHKRLVTRKMFPFDEVIMFGLIDDSPDGHLLHKILKSDIGAKDLSFYNVIIFLHATYFLFKASSEDTEVNSEIGKRTKRISNSKSCFCNLYKVMTCIHCLRPHYNDVT